MKNIVKTIVDSVKLAVLTTATLALLSDKCEAASSVIQTPAGVVPVVLVSNACRTVQFVFSNTNLAANAYHSLFDAPALTTIGSPSPAFVGPSITNITASYTTISLSSLLVTNVYTNYFGVAYATNVQYQAVQHVTNTVAQATNTYPLVLQIIVPTNSTLTVDFNQQFIRGILDTNSGAGSVTTIYSQ